MMAAEQFTGQPGSTVPAEGDHRGVRQAGQGRLRPSSRAGVLPHRRPRGSGEEGREPRRQDGRRRRRRRSGDRRTRTSTPTRATMPTRANERWPNWTSTSSPSSAKSGRARPRSSSPVPPSGEIGILPRHIPLVAQLVDDAMVRVEREGEDDLRIAVDGGFMSVTDDGGDHSRGVRRARVGDRRRQRASATPSPTIPQPPPEVERGCAPWVRSTSGRR